MYYYGCVVSFKQKRFIECQQWEYLNFSFIRPLSLRVCAALTFKDFGKYSNIYLSGDVKFFPLYSLIGVFPLDSIVGSSHMTRDVAV